MTPAETDQTVQVPGKLKIFFQAIRPKTLVASLSPILLGLACAFRQQPLDQFVALMTILAGMTLQITANLSNDYFDFLKGIDGPMRLGPQRFTSSGIFSQASMKKALIISFCSSIFLGVALMIRGGGAIVAIGLLSLYFTYRYSGGTTPLSHRGLGEILALIIFGPMATWGTYYLQTLKFSWTPIFLGFGPGFLAAALMAINNLRDQKSDALAGKKTLAVMLGETRGRTLCLLLPFLSCLPVLLAITRFGFNGFLLLASFSFLLFFFQEGKKILKGPIDSELNISLGQMGKLISLYGIFFALGIAYA